MPNAKLPDPLELLDLQRPLTNDEDRALADECRDALIAYRAALSRGSASRTMTARARRAFIHLGDPARPTASLKYYDHRRYGPFLGVSDEGSAAGAAAGAYAFEHGVRSEDLIANVFMRLGDRESAIQWLAKGAASNVGGIEFSLEDPLYAPLRSDPRIQAIIERLKVR